MLINYTDKERDLLARIMRAEALSEGNLGMMMVGNVVVNRCVTECYIFKNIRSITDAIYQKNQFSGINNSLFEAKPTSLEKNLADRILRGEYYHPATKSLWFCYNNSTCNSTWFDQPLAGKYKNHCFYKPDSNNCL